MDHSLKVEISTSCSAEGQTRLTAWAGQSLEPSDCITNHGAIAHYAWGRFVYTYLPPRPDPPFCPSLGVIPSELLQSLVRTRLRPTTILILPFFLSLHPRHDRHVRRKHGIPHALHIMALLRIHLAQILKIPQQPPPPRQRPRADRFLGHREARALHEADLARDRRRFLLLLPCCIVVGGGGSEQPGPESARRQAGALESAAAATQPAFLVGDAAEAAESLHGADGEDGAGR